MSLSDLPVIAFLATTDAGRCKDFYSGVLGLALREDSPVALAFDAGGMMLRIQKVDKFQPHAFTALGWQTADIARQTRSLAEAGVAFERYAGMEQDDDGVWTAPSGAKIAWFRDPDGNVLSLTEFG